MHETKLHNFTLIVPTHNRHHYLKRSIAFFNNLEAAVIYCDSSLEQYTELMGEKISYLHLPGKKFAEKILIALDCVKTDYVAMCADDDFILYSALYKGISVLEKEFGFKTVVGKYIAFHEEFDGTFYKKTKSLPKDINFNASNNAKVFFSNYYQILWAMYQKEILVEAFEIINKARFANDRFFELVIGSIVCYSGGIKFLNEIWGVRELNISEHWAKRHKPIAANTYQDRNIKRDFQQMKSLVDPLTFHGFSNLVLTSYLKVSKVSKIKDTGQKIKEILKDKTKELLCEKVILSIRRRRRNQKTYHALDNNLHELDQIREIIVMCGEV